MMKRAVAIAIVLASLSTPAAGQGLGKLAGSVRAIDSDAPIQGASVTLEEHPLGAVTNAEGRNTSGR